MGGWKVRELGNPVRSLTPRDRDRLRRWAWAAVDAAIWFFAIFAATWLRYDFDLEATFVVGTLAFACIAVLAHLLVGALIGPYAVGHQRGSFEESLDIAQTVVVTTPALAAWAVLADPIIVPRSVPWVAYLT